MIKTTIATELIHCIWLVMLHIKGNTQNQLEFELEGFMQRVLIRHANTLRF
ncbi:hypothetical protein BSPLISOX_454 [uncultured Gammaproteobacteria bacterium]|nr:hypothetical protein [uncultured Gammaproteobacteria bacterium]VVH67235.1 hypothetical protein BSPLISOX_454 [uncultured Gammaproteobacteria bacterium]